MQVEEEEAAAHNRLKGGERKVGKEESKSEGRKEGGKKEGE